MATTSTRLSLCALVLLLLLGLQVATCARCFDDFEFMAMRENQRHTFPLVGYSSVVGQQITVTRMTDHFLLVFKVHHSRHKRLVMPSNTYDFGLKLLVDRKSGTGYDVQMATFHVNKAIFRGLARIVVNIHSRTTEDTIKATLNEICDKSFLKSYAPFEKIEDETQQKVLRALDYLYHWNGRAHSHVIEQKLTKVAPATLLDYIVGEIKKAYSLCSAHGLFSERFDLRGYRTALASQRDDKTGSLTHPTIASGVSAKIDEDLRLLEYKQVSDGYYTTTLPDFGKSMAKLSGMEYLYHGSSSAAVRNVLKGGSLLSREVLHKRMLLNGFQGKSGATDEGSGGASFIFLRAATSKLMSERAKLGKYSDTDDGATLFFPVNILDRLDWFSYTYDAYGATNTDAYRNRMPTAVMMRQLQTVVDSRNEIMIRDSLPTALAMLITAKNKLLFEEITALVTQLRYTTVVARSHTALGDQMLMPRLVEGIPKIPSSVASRLRGVIAQSTEVTDTEPSEPKPEPKPEVEKTEVTTGHKPQPPSTSRTVRGVSDARAARLKISKPYKPVVAVRPTERRTLQTTTTVARTSPLVLPPIKGVKKTP